MIRSMYRNNSCFGLVSQLHVILFSFPIDHFYYGVTVPEIRHTGSHRRMCLLGGHSNPNSNSYEDGQIHQTCLGTH